MGAGVSGKRPLSNPDGVLNILGWFEALFVVITVCHDIWLEFSSKADVLMCVKDDIIHISIREEGVPGLGIIVIGLMENELSIWSICAEYLSHILVIPFEESKISSSKRLIDWLKSHESWEWSEVLNNLGDLVKGIHDFLSINRGIGHGLNIPFSHPVGSLVDPVLVMGFISPCGQV